jgi:hypothetical protein
MVNSFSGLNLKIELHPGLLPETADPGADAQTRGFPPVIVPFGRIP